MTSPESDERFTTLFQRHYPDVHAYCARRIGFSEADDVAAEVFATAWRRMDDIATDSAESWLYGVARRILANRWRSMRRRSDLTRRIAGLAPALSETPEIQVMHADAHGDVFRALKRMRASDREVLMLAAWEELSAPQIAEALAISTSAAEQRLHRAKVRFAGVLEQDVERSGRRKGER